MSLIPWNPFREMDNIGREMSNFFDFPSKLFSGSPPRVDVYQTEKDVIVKAEIPGVSKEDLNLYIDDNSIRLSGQTKKEKELKDENVYRSERYYGSFSRTIPLPVEVKSEEAKAEYKDGILSIIIPKVEPSKTRGRKIDIQ
ncbi:heat-shock protein Hsp20 [Clostridium thermosuccinogenes]|uniref:Heat-shock protein Hsp20 n=1 Tax=Clostridium thermosuccinogenes TaxID=84032 RepID=A0A2K2FCI6_9CLOT|nr:Hsp20/alpha crystallin family protein [Pseudoclostridium thermosuccinogenes]AUS95379.1 heat-shock protein Hsp20 [Pseudoclostridium thermosuccinogenes]PNT90563.1 heat-shock protein Hsp20 [Pseudoclostridium thermosuccinogenes]PNT95496.1 heat-shock protein Hsp20 [Pseudoclostridium thermosuccinogenes]PNT96502.1 heat-shock protein Hsp20 [Pseudoclostridium thermosuccinogenes]